MCIRVRYAPLDTACSKPFDADSGVITLPRDLPRGAKICVVRRVLTELCIPQSVFGAVCWCGAPVRLSLRVPRKMRREQVTHGA